MKTDVCCFLCRSQYGCMNSRCDHHVAARIEEDANDRARKLYSNPTQDQATANIEREERDRRRR